MFSPAFWQGQKDLSRLPARVLLPSGERPAPTEAAAETGAWTQPTGLQAPTTRTAGEPAGAPRCQILPHTNEKSQVPQKRYLTFLAVQNKNEPSDKFQPEKARYYAGFRAVRPASHIH